MADTLDLIKFHCSWLSWLKDTQVLLDHILSPLTINRSVNIVHQHIQEIRSNNASSQAVMAENAWRAELFRELHLMCR